MNLNTRIQKLEQQVPPPPEPKSDLSTLSIEELHLMARYKREKDQVTEEETQRLEGICGKIIWR